MNSPLLSKRKWNYLALAFGVPFTAVVVLMICVGCTPFGSRSMLYSDMFHQYFPFFKAFRKALLSGESLLFSWDVGMGMDYLGLISYYLASPLNLLSVLLPESWALPYFSLLVPIKLGLASLFFALFLKKLFGRNDLSIALFGSFYGLCAWALGYQWNIMWLDTFALLPLVALGTVSLLRDRKFILYTVSLFLSIFANYYVGFFTCIFVLLLFICYQICRCKSVVGFFRDLVRIGCFSALAIGMTAILTLPALAALGNTYSSVNSFPEGFSLNIVNYASCADAREAWEVFKVAKEAGAPSFWLWIDAMKESFGPVLEGMRQVAGNMAGGVTPTFKEGLPNIYCGVGTILLSFLFLTARQVKIRDKICAVFLLIFFMLSFILRQLDYIWHGFHFTNMIPYRFSFLYSFVMLYMAYRAYCIRYRFRVWQLTIAGVLAIFVLSLSDTARAVPEALGALGELFARIGTAIAASSSGDVAAQQTALTSLQSLYNTHADAYVFLVFNGVFFLLYFFLLLYPRLHRPLPPEATWEDYRWLANGRRNRRKVATVTLSLVLVIELVMNTVNFGTNFAYTNIENYPEGTSYTESMIRYMKEREDSLFYRVETTHSQTLNDGALNGYHGISTFTSSANVRVTEFMDKLGYASRNNWNRYCFEEGSPVSNLFLNLKYMLERQGNVEMNPYFDTVHHYGDVYLLENNAYLPLGFLANSLLAEADLENYGVTAIMAQNELFAAATGLPGTVWNNIPANRVTVEPTNVELGMASGIYCDYVASASGGYITYRYDITEEGFLCLDMDLAARNSFHVYLNGEYLFSESITLPQMLAVSQVRWGDVVEVRVVCKANEQSSMTIRGALLDEEMFREGYEILAASTLELTEFSTTKVAGTISCNRDGLLYTSIPYDGNWHATVDGEEVDIQLVGGAMVALNLTEGDHEIVFTYHSEAFSLGWKVTTLCLLVFLGLVCWNKQEWLLTQYKKLRQRASKK